MNTVKPTFITYLTAIIMSIGLSLSAQAAGKSDNAPVQNGPKNKTTLLQKVVEVNEATGEFSTLKAAVLAADPAVVMTLSQNGQHTVFAPTDEAFGNLGLNADNVACTLSSEDLTAVLVYHVVKGRLLSGDVLASDKLNTILRGRDGFLGQSEAVLTDNLGRTSQIDVSMIDIETTNGVIHVIEDVVLPYMPTLLTCPESCVK